MQDLRLRLKDKTQIAPCVLDVLQDPSLIEQLLDIIKREKGSTRFACTKIIRQVSAQKPEVVYAYFEDIVELLHSENSFILWDGINILANLAEVDTQDKFENIFTQYFALLEDPHMITAANVVGAAWKIALAKPQHEAEITRRLLAVDHVTYMYHNAPSPECHHVVCGHVIDCFAKYFAVSLAKQEMLVFVKAQLQSSRRPVAQKARKFLKLHGDETLTSLGS